MSVFLALLALVVTVILRLDPWEQVEAQGKPPFV